jgi:hypothetical protein
MTVPSQMSLRRIPEALHLQVRIAYATAWEALIATHTSQAQQFLCEFASRVSVLEGMDLYFRVTAVPEAMQEVVRSRTLTSLELESLAPLTPMPVLTGWQRFRLDMVLDHQRYRRRFQDKTIELARMVGARAAEAVVATHVENAIGVLPSRIQPPIECGPDGIPTRSGSHRRRGAHSPVRRAGPAACHRTHRGERVFAVSSSGHRRLLVSSQNSKPTARLT